MCVFRRAGFKMKVANVCAYHGHLVVEGGGSE